MREEFEKLVADIMPQVREISVAETLRKIKERAVLIDVREDNEWETEHAENAVHIGRGVIEALELSDRSPVDVVREWGVRRLGQELEIRTSAGIEKRVTADFFPAYDDDGGLLIALTPR